MTPADIHLGSMEGTSNRRSVHAAFTMDPETWDLLDRESKARHVSKSALIRILIVRLADGNVKL